MATISHLLDEMAAASILSRIELAWRARHLRGEITPGKRGKAGTATSRDAAVLSIAAMSTAPAPKLRDAVCRIGGKTIRCDIRFAYTFTSDGKPAELKISDEGASFEEVLIAVIDLRRHPDVHIADKAGNFSRVGVREAVGHQWPWIEMQDSEGARLYVNDKINGRFVFGDSQEYALTGRRGLVRETTIGATELYAISAALGLEWKQTPGTK